MTLKVCQYCSKEQEAAIHCAYCGAPLPKEAVLKEDGFYFFLNGYVVWVVYEPASDVDDFYFYRGAQLMEHFSISRRLRRDVFDCASLGTEDFLWQLFLVAQGQQEVLSLIEQDVPLPATFEIRCIENPERARWRELWTSQDFISIVQEIRK